MPSNFALGILMGLLAGLVNGIFLLPMRYARKWEWENTWLFFAVLSTVLLPWVAALAAVPHLAGIFRALPGSALLPGLIAGLVWGVAQVLYGLGCGIMGIAIGSAVISSMSITAGTAGPLLAYAPARFLSLSTLPLWIAVALIVTGFALYGKASARKERETAGLGERQIVKGSVRKGLLICLASGLLGTAFIYGGRSSTAILAAAQAAGAPSLVAFYAAFVVTFNAGCIPGLLYSLYLLRRNKSGQRFRESFLWNLGMAASMAVLWYGGILLYGMSSEEMGKLGPSLAFALFGSGTVLFANLFGWLAGEWRGASRPTIQGFLKGMALIILAVLIIAFGMRTPG